MSDAFKTVSLGKDDSELKVSSNKSYKFPAGAYQRVAIASWNFAEDGYLNMDGDPNILMAPVSWVKTDDLTGNIVHANEEFTKIIGEEPKYRCACSIVLFPVNPDGSLDSDLFKLGRWKVERWSFTATKYQKLKNKHALRSLAAHDLQIKCTNEQYQNLEWETYGESLLAKLIDKARAAKAEGGEESAPLVAKVDKLMSDIRKAEKNLTPLIGRVVDIDDLRAAMGGSVVNVLEQTASADGEEAMDSMLEGF